MGILFFFPNLAGILSKCQTYEDTSLQSFSLLAGYIGKVPLICSSSLLLVFVFVFIPFRETGSYDAVLFCSLKGCPLRQEFSDY